MTVMTYADAAKAALAEEMRRDPLVWAVGEDLGRGGVFGQYKGLVEEFGSERISDAPISEAAIICLLYTSPSPRDGLLSRMPSSA